MSGAAIVIALAGLTSAGGPTSQMPVRPEVVHTVEVVHSVEVVHTTDAVVHTAL